MCDGSECSADGVQRRASDSPEWRPQLTLNGTRFVTALQRHVELIGHREEAEEPTEDVALEDEIALQRDYLAIEEVRFPERLLVAIDLPDDLERARVPGMILQPLVENSVRYAVARSTTPVRVSIEAFAADGRLHLVVADNGPGLPEGTGGGFGIGLSNVRDRLKARFGSRAQVRSGKVEGGGYRTELIMPLDFNDGR